MTITDLHAWTSAIVAAAEKDGSEDAWAFAYRTVFTKDITDQARGLGVTWLGYRMGYEDDVRDFARGVERVFEVGAEIEQAAAAASPGKHKLPRPDLDEAREAAQPALASEWACMVLDASRMRYDRRGWHDVARRGARKIHDLVIYIDMLEAERKKDA